jgi:hypothetical protein
MSAANTPQTPGSYPTTRPADSAPHLTGGSFATVEPPAGERPDYFATYSRTSYRPTTEQLIRDEARRRYLRRNVYAPIIVAVVIVVVLFALIVYLGFWARSPQAVSFIAGLSALTIILMSLPLIVLMSIPPIVWLVITINRRQQRRNFPETGPMAYRGRVQIWLWQLDGLLNETQLAVVRGSAALRRPLTAIHTRAVYWRQMARGIRSRFLRSD